MIRYTFAAPDVAALRFGISPLNELGLGLRALRRPEHYPLQAAWIERIAPVLPVLDQEVLLHLVDERRWVADFLNPRPASPLTSIDDELAALSRITPERLRADLEPIHGRLPAVFSGEHRAVVRRMVEAIAGMWHLCFAPHWPRMRSVLQADITHRGRLLASGGYADMFASLAKRVSWDGKHLDVRTMSNFEAQQEVGGRGFTLMPSIFVTDASTLIDLELPPMLMYPARGQGAMWGSHAGTDRGALSQLLGSTRAELLAALGEPASSTELALRFGVSASAINQHLRVLERTGLLNRTRYGRSVLYYRSDLGESLASGA
ncbi:MAG: winged helix-turn-helix domain-containing protein [Arthrobacter sp.]|jgi:DNA-binding transcriptional ArsR family regulator|nr:winged helix-turn-helix domain-containing protein [Arthrobacter sp.]